MGGVDQPGHGIDVVLLRRRTGQVAPNVVDGATQHIELVAQIFQLGPSHDHLGFVQPVPSRSLPSLEVTLAA